MHHRTTCWRILLAALCTLTGLTGFARAASAGGGDGDPTVARPWSVTAECHDGVGVIASWYHGPTETLSTGWVSFSCTGTWSATLNYRLVGTSPQVDVAGDTSAADAVAQMPLSWGAPDASKELWLVVDCTGGHATATLYYGDRVVQTNSVDCHGLEFAWSISF